MLKAVVIGLGVLIVIALGFVAWGMARKISSAPPDTDRGPAMFALPANAQILDMQTQPGRTILHVRTPKGDEVLIIDTETGRVVGEVKALK
jgi:hypothetical protein